MTGRSIPTELTYIGFQSPKRVAALTAETEKTLTLSPHPLKNFQCFWKFHSLAKGHEWILLLG